MARPKKDTTNETIVVTNKSNTTEQNEIGNEIQVTNNEIKVETTTNTTNNTSEYVGNKYIINRLEKTITKPNQYYFNDILGTKKATFGMNNISAFEVTNENLSEFESLLKQYKISI